MKKYLFVKNRIIKYLISKESNCGTNSTKDRIKKSTLLLKNKSKILISNLQSRKLVIAVSHKNIFGIFTRYFVINLIFLPL